MENPYTVPSFSTFRPCGKLVKTFFWWSWHPLYPYWSKSCWGGYTAEEARNVLRDNLSYYHNKLIQQTDEGLIEIEDSPCKRLDIWQKIYKQQNATTQP